MGVKSWSGVVLLGVVLGIAGCDGGLPHDDGVWWICSGTASIEGAPVGVFGPGVDDVSVCANVGVPDDEILRGCVEKCVGRYTEWGFFDICEIDPSTGEQSCHPSFRIEPNCIVFTATAGVHPANNCDPPAVEFYQGGPASYSVAFARDGAAPSSFALTLRGHTAGGFALGRLDYSISPPEGPCPGGQCRVEIPFIELHADDVAYDFGFPVGTKRVTGMVVRNSGVVRGTMSDDGTILIPALAMQVSTNFDVNGEHASATIGNLTPLRAHIDRSTGAFTIIDATFASGDASITFSLFGDATRLPPTAAFSPTAPVECDGAAAASVHLDARATADPYTDVQAFYWLLPGSADVRTGEQIDASLPLGNTQVQLQVVDLSGGYDMDIQTVTVVDTMAPQVVAPADVSVAGCGPATVDLGSATASDVCSGALAVRGRVVQVNGLPTDLPLTNAFVFPPGESLVEYSADDGNGNTSTAVQHVVISEGVGCCPAGLETLVGTASADTLIAGNRGQCILGEAGNDMIDGRNSQDLVFAGLGDDVALGSNAVDTIDGGPGDDAIDGGNGADLLIGGPGRDEVHGGLGPDVIRIRGACEVQSGEVIDGGGGPDTLETPITLAALVALGVTVTDIENVVLVAPEPGRCP